MLLKKKNVNLLLLGKLLIVLIFVTLENLSYKDKKALKEKATAGSSHNWNTLFLGTDAVAEAMAATYNTTKEKVFFLFINFHGLCDFFY